MQNLLNDALDYAARGWHIVPLHTPIKGRCTCGYANCPYIGKHPRTEHGVHDATTDANQIKEWFEMWPNANVGIATGARSGFDALDIDPRHGGDDSLAALIAKHGRLPDTVEDVTGGGGAHVYLEYPGFKIPNITLAPGIEFKADGKIIVAPFSLHESGRRYEFEASSHPDRVKIAAAPDWLLAELETRTRKETQTVAHVVTATGTPRLALAILRGTSKREYYSRSEAEHAAVTSLVNAGWHFEDVLNLFQREAHAKTHFVEKHRKPQDRERWLKQAYDDAVQFVRTHESKGTKIARERRTWALSFDWQGRTRGTDQAVALAHCHIAERSGRSTYQASVRELAEYAGVTPIVVSRANQRLEQLAVIERIQDYDPKKPSQAIVWELKPTGGVNVVHSQNTINESECTTYDPPIAHDLFRVRLSRTRKRLGLGKIGFHVWKFMQDMQPHSIGEIARKSRHDKKAVRKIMDKMHTADMVQRIGDKWQALQNVDLDRAAGVLGMLGTGEVQKAKHAADRRARAIKLKQGAHQ